MTKEDRLKEFLKAAKDAGFQISTKSDSPPVEHLLSRKTHNWAVQILVKGRWWAERDLMNQDVWIAFPEAESVSPGNWYVVPHDLIVAHGKIKHKNTQSWKDGLYHKRKISKDMIALYAPYKIEALAGYSPNLIQLLLLQNAKNWE